MQRRYMVTGIVWLAMWATVVEGRTEPGREVFANSLGMKFARIEAGQFSMGQRQGGDWDERPVVDVRISKPFYMGVTEVTNAQYERFDPGHRVHRGRSGLSQGDNEAVVFVSWYDAVAFCRWLSKKEGTSYRLPTEAEWEYACRAGTTTVFGTGDTLPKVHHKHQEESWRPTPVSLAVGMTPANAWGLHEMHGNVEEWCHDWYGPYPQAAQVDQRISSVGQRAAAGTAATSRGSDFAREFHAS